MNDGDHYDVIQIGYGPGGQSLAALLASVGDRVLVVERHPELYNLPRAGHIDHEVVRTVQAVGRADELEPKLGKVAGDYIYVNGDYEVLMSHPIDPGGHSVSGWFSDFTLWQPVLEDAFHGAAVAAGAEVALGWDASDVRQDADRVHVRLRGVTYADNRRVFTGETRDVSCAYLVAADGANSSVRASLDVAQEDLGFDAEFLVVDMLNLTDHPFEPNMAQVCDPARPRMLIPIGPYHRRFEFALLPGETVEEMERPETAWRLVGEWGVTPETHAIVRQIVYRFQALVAQSWRSGRIFLLGDAAHTMPPFAGQGLGSAVRDSANLAWKLHLVLAGLADESLLDSYAVERDPHVREWISISIEEGKINCVWDRDEATARDARFRAGWRPPIYETPSLAGGILSDSPHPLIGKLFLQARVRTVEGEHWLEDVASGYRFRLVTYGVDPDAFLGADQRAVLNDLNAAVVHLAPGGGPDGDPAGALYDTTGAYGAWFSEHGICAVLERPDFAVYGVAATPADLDALVDDLRRDLGLRRAVAPAAGAAASR